MQCALLMPFFSMQDFSDRLEREPAGSALLAHFERHAHAVAGASWDERLPADLLVDAGQHRRYNYASLQARDVMVCSPGYPSVTAPLCSVCAPFPCRIVFVCFGTSAAIGLRYARLMSALLLS
jgi:hypothetical protein